MKKNPNGFTLIEMMLVILIIGLLASIGIPKFMSYGQDEVTKFINSLNSLILMSSQDAQTSGKVQKILFDFVAHKIEFFDIDNKKAKKSIPIPETINIDDFLINGKSQFRANSGPKLSAFFLINPQGITQDTKIIITQKINPGTSNEENIKYNLQLNPFVAQLERA